MEIIYCSKCGTMIPPGGIDEGKYFLVEAEPVCPKCYESTPAEKHTGDTMLGEQKVERRKPTDGVASQQRRGTPPSTQLAVRQRPSTKSMAAAKRARTSSRSMPAAQGGGSFKIVVALVIALLVLGSIIGLVATRGGSEPGRAADSYALKVKAEGEGRVALEAPAALPAGQVYLADVGARALLSKQRTMIEIGKDVKIAGARHAKCITVKPKQYGSMVVVCDLGGKYSTLEFGKAMRGTSDKSRLHFNVFGDDDRKPLYRSNEPGEAKVDVSGVGRLYLKVYTAREPPAGARGVWLSPRLTLKARQ
jgi:NPCBM/NEW2 domain